MFVVIRRVRPKDKHFAAILGIMTDVYGPFKSQKAADKWRLEHRNLGRNMWVQEIVKPWR